VLNHFIAHSPDLKRLCQENFDICIVNNYLVVKNVPYIDQHGTTQFGCLCCPIEFNGNRAVTPKSHQAWFTGTVPHDENGNALETLSPVPCQLRICNAIVANFSFSWKVQDRGYEDYYELITTYYDHINESFSNTLENEQKKSTIKISQKNTLSPFKYGEEALNRSGMLDLNSMFLGKKIAIVGLGGTGSYVLDLVAKTSVEQIHLIDDDEFEPHNAFRAPGAPNSTLFQNVQKKVHYYQSIYENMRTGIVTHNLKLVEENMKLLDGMNFVFFCTDVGIDKIKIGSHLKKKKIRFLDVGMSAKKQNDMLQASVRVTVDNHPCFDQPLSVNNQSNKSECDTPQDNIESVYGTNIQIAEINALNACFAVITWKKICSFYSSKINSDSFFYTSDFNVIHNE